MPSWPLVLLVAAAGCSGREEGPRSTLTDAEAASMRAACAFKAGTPAGSSLAKGAPIGGEIPIDTIVVVMMENRSFDHLFGELPGFGQPDVDVATHDATNPDSTGAPIARFHMKTFCDQDTAHGWRDSHTQWNGGNNDGFVITNEHLDRMPPVDGSRAMGWYDSTDLPFLYAAANTFAISDRNFAALLGPTLPNREYLYAATSYGRTVNEIFTTGERANFMTLIEAHNALGKDPVSWHIYYDGVPGSAVFVDTITKYLDNVSRDRNFFEDAAAGTLANVNFLDANLREESGGGNDFHPPGDVQRGDEFLAMVAKAVIASPQWPHLALFITFDEHGGLYDHVPPPEACAPDDLLPMVRAGDTQYDFARRGFRVPLIVISPYAKPHYVSHHVTDHTSITRFIEARFRLPAMTARDANAEPLTDLFDFGKPSLAHPPALPTPVVDPAALADCEARFPPKPSDIVFDGGLPD